MRILFSPVGGMDPISSTNFRDGSMLHIARIYQPDKILLYISKEMLEFHHNIEDNRYLYCLEQLDKRLGRKTEIEVIERPDLDKVYEFDYFYSDFRNILKDILNGMTSEDELLVNISSGTPAMKSGLAVLATMIGYHCRLIQVFTPEKKMHTHVHDNYDVKMMWELNEDNQGEVEKRCREIKCPTLDTIKIEQVINKLILTYNYSGAIEAANGLPDDKKALNHDLLKMAYARLQLDSRTLDAISKKCEIDCIPVKSSGSRKLLEYALSLDIKRRKQEYADYLRGLSPLFVQLLRLLLKNRYQIDIDNYTKNNEEDWDLDKLRKNQTLKNILDEGFTKNLGKLEDSASSEGFRGGKVYSIHLVRILEGIDKSPDDRNSVIPVVRELRKVEEEIRNKAAHQMTCVTEEEIEKMVGISSKKIKRNIEKLFDYAKIPIKTEYWDSYDLMNEMIIDRLS